MKHPLFPQSIGTIPNAASLAHYIKATPTLFQNGLFVITAHPSERHIIARLLPHFYPERSHPTILEWNGEIQTLPHLSQYDIVVADQKTIEHALLPAPATLNRQTIHVQIDDTLSLQTLIEKIVDSGFERDTTATRAETFAVRGDILDIHIDQLYRLSFFGDSVESIATVDHNGQSTPFSLPLKIAPRNSKGRSTFFDYIPPHVAVLLFDTDLPENSLTENILIRASRLAVPEEKNGSVVNPPYRLPKSYHLRRDELLADIDSTKSLILFTQDTAALQQFIQTDEASFSEKNIVEIDGIDSGFMYDDADSPLLCLTDGNIGLSAKKQKKASKKLQRALMQQLSVGDYVVHIHHGVARFAGMTNQEINGMMRDYFVLEYAGRDKVYVPVELADRLDKYIGEEQPELNTLSGASWNTALKTASEDVARIAQELLDIYARRESATGHHIVADPQEQRLDDACPYDLTVDQNDALEQIFHDMQQDKPMDRLLCGDVGFGKTEVALRASFRAVLNGYQVAVVAPTTILCQQHADTFAERLSSLGVNVASLSRFQTKAEQHDVIKGLHSGKVDVVIGTHRLFSADIGFKKLGLIVIDEEQRFGVRAKEALTAMRAQAHVLTMTATPIPRTLHLSLSGIREISTILTPPKLRRAVELSIVPQDNATIISAVEREMARGGEVYYVYNRVQSIERRRIELQALLGDAVRIGVAHGQLKPKELADVMHAFDTKQLDVLLASSIVENGLDIASANTMIVEDASRFGLSELYQLKGRVGRSKEQGYAYFFYKEKQLDGDVRSRFLALQSASGLGDGFELAMRDMEIRGVGNMLGKAQHGHTSKIGLHLYVRLLHSAVAQLQGKETATIREVAIDVPLEGRIPEECVPEIEQRIRLYQEVSNARDEDELSDIQAELMKQERLWEGTSLHPDVAGLLEIVLLKIIASKSTLIAITTDYPNDVNRLSSPRITLSSNEALPDLPDAWERIYERGNLAFKARALTTYLGDNWMKTLQETVRLCSPHANQKE